MKEMEPIKLKRLNQKAAFIRSVKGYVINTKKARVEYYSEETLTTYFMNLN